jgi:hypothetical protein
LPGPARCWRLLPTPLFSAHQHAITRDPCRKHVPPPPKWPLEALRNAPPLSPRGTRAGRAMGGAMGRPAECATTRPLRGTRRAGSNLPRRAPRAGFPAFPGIPVSPGCRSPPDFPRPPSRPPRSPPGRGTENLESWQPAESANARQDPRFPDSPARRLLARATAAAGCTSLMRDRARLKTLVQHPLPTATARAVKRA